MNGDLEIEIATPRSAGAPLEEGAQRRRALAGVRVGQAVPAVCEDLELGVASRRGWASANASPTVPPADSPTKWKRSAPAASATAMASATSASKLQSNSAGGRDDRPKPRVSKRTMRPQSARTGSHSLQI